jgi:hypothetical protein
MVNNILFILNREDVKIDKEIKKNKEKNIYIASYSLEILEKYKNNNNIQEVFYLEEMHTIFENSDQVKKIIKRINQFLGVIIADDELCVSEHVEGGNNQAILDIVLFKLSFDKILDDNKIDSIINYTTPAQYKESVYIRDISIERDIINKKYVANKFEYFKIYFKIKYLKYLHGITSLIKYIILKIKFTKNIDIKDQNTIFINICSDANKFYTAFKNFAINIESHSDTKCYFVTNNLINNKDLVNENPFILEHFLKVSDFIKSYYLSFKYLIMYKLNKGYFTSFFFGVPYSITRQIEHVILYEIVAQFGYSYRYKKSLDRFMSKNRMIGWKVWGGGALPEGRIALNLIKEKYQNISSFAFDIGNNFYNYPFHSESNKLVDFKLFFNQHDYQIDLHNGFGAKKGLIIPELNIIKKMDELKLKYTQKNSLNIIGINKKYDQYIFIDINVRIRGYIHIQEVEIFIFNAKKMAEIFNNYAFIIKPHPSFKELSYLESKLHDVENIYTYGQNESIFHYLNASSIVITKQSTIGFEANFLGKVLVSLILDGEENWKVFGDFAYYFYSFDEVIEFLNRDEFFLISHNSSEKCIQKNEEKTTSDFLNLLLCVK